MSRSLHKFLDWWSEAPLYQSIWFVPFVLTLFVIAFIKNLFTKQENKKQ